MFNRGQTIYPPFWRFCYKKSCSCALRDAFIKDSYIQKPQNLDTCSFLFTVSYEPLKYWCHLRVLAYNDFLQQRSFHFCLGRLRRRRQALGRSNWQVHPDLHWPRIWHQRCRLLPQLPILWNWLWRRYLSPVWYPCRSGTPHLQVSIHPIIKSSSNSVMNPLSVESPPSPSPSLAVSFSPVTTTSIATCGIPSRVTALVYWLVMTTESGRIRFFVSRRFILEILAASEFLKTAWLLALVVGTLSWGSGTNFRQYPPYSKQSLRIRGNPVISKPFLNT